MKKFLVLYESTVPASEQMKNATPAQAKAGMDAWMSWGGRAASAIVDMGSPVAAAAKVTGPAHVTGGQSPVSGFSILQAESKEKCEADHQRNEHQQHCAPKSSHCVSLLRNNHSGNPPTEKECKIKP